MADLTEAIRSWAAGREGVSQLEITDIEFDFDEGWPGTDVTPGDMPEVEIQYRVSRRVVYRREVAELGDFIRELADAMAKRPAVSMPQAPKNNRLKTQARQDDSIEIDLGDAGPLICTPLLVAGEQTIKGGRDVGISFSFDVPEGFPEMRVVCVLAKVDK